MHNETLKMDLGNNSSTIVNTLVDWYNDENYNVASLQRLAGVQIPDNVPDSLAIFSSITKVISFKKNFELFFRQKMFQ